VLSDGGRYCVFYNDSVAVYYLLVVKRDAGGGVLILHKMKNFARGIFCQVLVKGGCICGITRL
jgi:hypothetical protein